jgi:hypothetical protein
MVQIANDSSLVYLENSQEPSHAIRQDARGSLGHKLIKLPKDAVVNVIHEVGGRTYMGVLQTYELMRI